MEDFGQKIILYKMILYQKVYKHLPNMRVEGVVVGEDAIAAEVALPAAIIRVVLGVVLAGGRSEAVKEVRKK